MIGRIFRFIMFMLITVPLPVLALDQERTGASVSGGKISPHKGKADCQICHVESEDSLTSWFTFASTKKKLRLDFNEICQQCHGVEFGHGVGAPPGINRKNLPLDQNGMITCAITCHEMHVVADDPAQNRYHLRFPVLQLCKSCHQK